MGVVRVELPEDLEQVIRDRVADGQFTSAEAFLAEAARWLADELAAENDDRVTALRSALSEGERSGPPQPFDFEDFLEGKRRPQP